MHTVMKLRVSGFFVFSAERDADRYKKKQTENSIRRLFLLSAVRIVTQNTVNLYSRLL